MPRLTSVKIKRFKSLVDFDLDLGDVTLLIGANNAGKSSVLQAIHFAVSIAQTARLVGEGIAWQKGTFELSFNPAQLLYSPVADVLSLANGGTLQEPRPSQIEIEFLDAEGNRCSVGLRRGRNRNIAVSIVGRQIGERLMDLAQPFTVYAPGLAGIPKEERFLSPGVVRRIVARGDANLTLRNVLRMLRANNEKWHLFVEDMRSIFAGIEIEIDFDEDTDEWIGAYFRFDGGPRLQVDAAGTSVLQASQILAYIALFEPQLLILDEPDSHLHPNNQRSLCGLIFRLAERRGFQALISTHSRHVLDSVRGLGSVVWLSKGAKVDTPDLNTTSVLMELGALDSVDYFADGEIHCVVATEDSSEESKRALRAVLASNGFVEVDTEIASYAGCTKVESALVLGAFLSSKAPNITLVVHRDRDYMGGVQAKKFNERLRNAGIRPFLTEFSDLDGYFLNADHIHSLNPTVPIERAQALIDQAITEVQKESLEAVINSRTEQAFRERNESGKPPNHGAIATTAHEELARDPKGMMRGKLALRRLRNLLQMETGANPRIFHPSEHLAISELRALSEEIWNSTSSCIDS
ncbi:AAA family ATPase [Methylocystis sp.]|uniref:AAA family ATPase n=1 Tax=Methylocystis sp. TaxID=1911079 RepID=UPI003DA45273